MKKENRRRTIDDEHRAVVAVWSTGHSRHNPIVGTRGRHVRNYKFAAERKLGESLSDCGS